MELHPNVDMVYINTQDYLLCVRIICWSNHKKTQTRNFPIFLNRN